MPDSKRGTGTVPTQGVFFLTCFTGIAHRWCGKGFVMMKSMQQKREKGTSMFVRKAGEGDKHRDLVDLVVVFGYHCFLEIRVTYSDSFHSCGRSRYFASKLTFNCDLETSADEK